MGRLRVMREEGNRENAWSSDGVFEVMLQWSGGRAYGLEALELQRGRRMAGDGR